MITDEQTQEEMSCLDIDIDRATKDELSEYAREKLRTELNMGKRIAELRADVRSLVEEAVEGPTEDGKPRPQYVRNPETGFVFEATPILLARKDLIPCDAEGKDV